MSSGLAFCALVFVADRAPIVPGTALLASTAFRLSSFNLTSRWIPYAEKAYNNISLVPPLENRVGERIARDNASMTALVRNPQPSDSPLRPPENNSQPLQMAGLLPSSTLSPGVSQERTVPKGRASFVFSSLARLFFSRRALADPIPSPSQVLLMEAARRAWKLSGSANETGLTGPSEAEGPTTTASGYVVSFVTPSSLQLGFSSIRRPHGPWMSSDGERRTTGLSPVFGPDASLSFFPFLL